ncbi:MAG: GNAT family N-acetyltransferase [Lachnospiraceae bacterium]|nr:GNAT family N-acetyltransferase [Lachnospiraceae bacterium]
MKEEDARNATRKAGLEQVVFDLGKEWGKETEALRERLRAEGITCVTLARKEADLQRILKTAAFGKREMVVLTDSPAAGKQLSQEGIVYFGCRHGEGVWFDGAALVLEGFEEVDGRYLEEWLCRAQGRPAWIAGTERLWIREMDEQDLPELVRIGKQENGMALLNEDAFTPERLHSYFVTAYRLQGFGLWSVLYAGSVIGCCGFAPYEEYNTREQIWVYRMCCETESAEMAVQGRKTDGQILELQYMLDAAYRRQGLGTEMCQAALQYARQRLAVDEIRLRIRPDNRASQALARKLGFIQEATFAGIPAMNEMVL